ncbi:MAG: insulinase family protein [Bacteroidales bacterium]|nr:insulinase family protein [Bacteroidales bacterium]
MRYFTTIARSIFVLAALCVAAVTAAAQQQVKVETFKLPNGLKVVLCEEHSTPQIYGCVAVHAGSKDENPAATGVAHYFEHIMFKGTDRIGTVNWAEEKLYLDSISHCYDLLRATSDKKQRQQLQQQLNRLSATASEYAIPNEVDAILQNMGCTGLNAGTSYDYTVYYNTLPANQLSNWMDVYVERFRNPVFRLFQSELEAVYEEKNMYENQPMYDFSRNIFTESFGSHPYSRDVIGLADHLKNPQPSEMQKFFDTYYVANNMTLILVGDFDIADVRPLVQNKFSVWRSGTLPEPPQYHLPPFDRQRVKTVRQTPVKAGLMIFPGVPASSRDYLPLQMASEILSTAFLDPAATQGRLMAAQLMPLSLEDAGSSVVLYIPNIIGQSHDAAEKVVWNCLDSLRQGLFSDEIMESVKMKAEVQRQRAVEDLASLSNLLLELELQGSSYQEWLRDNQRWSDLTREEVMEVAAKYFNPDRCTLVRSKMGFPKHDAAVKPSWDHLELHNEASQSTFAYLIASSVPDPIKPQTVDFRKDVDIQDITSGCKLYSARNPKNNLFELSITYRYGLMDDPDLDRAVQYLNALGTGDMTADQLKVRLSRLGATIGLGCSTNNQTSTLYITGLEENLDTILSLTSQWLRHPAHDAKQIAIIADAIQGEEKAAKNSSDTWFDALDQYVRYGKNSPYLTHTPYRQWSQHSTGEKLHHQALKILTRNGYATFTGNTDPSDLAQMLTKHHLLNDSVEMVPERAIKQKEYNKSQTFYLSNKKFLQSDIYIYVPSIDIDTADLPTVALFNEYYGGGMNSIIFQEIREFRSLGYSTYGGLWFDILNRNPARLTCYLGTQCDKTQEGVEALRDLIVTLPERPEKLAPAIEHQVITRNSSYITFRDLPAFVRDAVELSGWDRDRRADITRRISQLSIADLKALHAKYILHRPLIAIISGNSKKFNPHAVGTLLAPNAPVTELTYQQLFTW